MAEHDLELVVTRTELVAKGVMLLDLASPGRDELPAWDPGAHIDLRFASRGTEYVRQYSLCGRPTDRRTWTVAVLLVPEGRGGSACIHEAFAEGRTVKVTGPRNTFPLTQASHYLFIAGGIGITPLLPMVREVASAGRDWRLVYCGRSVDSMAFVEDVLALGEDRVLIHESDLRGQADLAALVAEAHPEAAVYCCGPEPMLQAVADASRTRPPEQVRFERFARRSTDEERTATEFEVEFARSGITVTVPADRSILEMAEELGVDIDSSCQEGVCGTCETGVLSGTPDHRDEVLTGKERAAGRSMMVCVSRSCSARLVLDA